MSNLKEFRTSHGYTQEELAKKVGASTGTISSYEQGNRNITVPMAMKLAVVFNVEWTIFFEDKVSVSYDKEKIN
ncbi:helix-turn-helix transcriptional regulator [Salinicoccus sesuvii]|uniref:Helix-turn-helix transcriptional regulator n=1 Tax=Salinicoccus sesuvii TaxID=868281 RepID=A0ABV7N704_9STAP